MKRASSSSARHPKAAGSQSHRWRWAGALGLILLLSLMFPAGQLLAADPTVTLSIPSSVMIGQDFSFTATFDTTTTGYGPFIDLIFPVNGADGNPTPDGVTFLSATYLGASVTTQTFTFPASPLGVAPCSAGQSQVPHPYALDTAHVPIPVCGTPGDMLVVVQLPFGSFTPTQPPATITLNAHLSNFADLSTPLNIRARGGFEFGADPLNNPCCDPTILNPNTPNSSVWTPVAAVTPTLLTINKTYNGPEDETATGPNYPHSYTVTVNLANGQTINNLDVSDYLDDNIIVTGISAIVGGGSVIQPGAFPLGPVNPPPPANQLIVRYPAASGTVSYNVNFYIPDMDANSASVINPSTGDDVITENRVRADGSWTPLDGRDPVTPVSANGSCPSCPPAHTLTDKSIAVQKSVATVPGGSRPRSGVVLQYTLNFQISDYFTFDDLSLADTISDGQHFDNTFTPTITITDRVDARAGNLTVLNPTTLTCNSGGIGANNTLVDTSEIGNDTNPATDGSTQVTFCISKALTDLGAADGILRGGRTNGANGGAATGTIVYRTVIQDNFTDTYPSGDSSVDHGDVLTNHAVVDGRILDNVSLVPTGSRETDDTAASVTIAEGTLQKSVYAINGTLVGAAPYEVTPGDDVTYRLRYEMPSSDFENFSITDFLPLPVFASSSVTSFDTTVSAASPPAGQAKFGPADTLFGIAGITPTISSSAGNNSVTFTYGSFDSPGNQDSFIDILFTVKVKPDPFADGLFLTNQARTSEGSTNSGTKTQDAIVQIQLREPILLIKKGVTDTSSPNEIFTPATVSPVPFNPVNNTASPPFTGTITAANLAANPVDSNASEVDAGDFVRFSITVQNTGGSGAFDIKLTDTVPPGYVIPSAANMHLQIAEGDGTAIGFTSSGIYGVNDPRNLFDQGVELVDPNAGTPVCQKPNVAPGKDIVVLTYDLQIDTSVGPGQTLVNTATIVQYAGEDGAGATDNHVKDTSLFQDDAQVTISSQPVKSIVSTSEAHTTGSTLAIGEVVRFHLEFRLAEGIATNLQFRDNVPTGMEFVNDGSAMAVFVSNGPGITSSTLGNPGFFATGAAPATPTQSLPGSAISGGPFGDGTDVIFSLGNITNSDDDDDAEYVVVEYNAVVMNTAGNNAGGSLSNTFTLRTNNTDVTTSAAVPMTIVEPSLTIAKSVVAPPPTDAQDAITYDIVVTASGAANTTYAFDVRVQDTLAAQLSLTSATLQTAPGYASVSTSNNVTGNPGSVDMTINELHPGDTFTIRVVAQVLITASTYQTISNQASLTYTSVPGTNGTGNATPGTPGSNTGERNGSGGVNDYSATSTAVTFTMPGLTFAKSIAGTSETSTSDVPNGLSNPNARPVAIGEIVTYRLTTTLPEGTTNNLVLRDTLAAGLDFIPNSAKISFVSDVDMTTAADLAGANNDAIPPTFAVPAAHISYNAGTRLLQFSLGTITNNDADNGSAEFVVIDFNVVVTDSAVNNTAQIWTNNYSVLTDASVNRGTSNNTFVKVVEPTLTIAKSIVGAVPTDAQDTVTYDLVVSASGAANTAYAFDVRVQDALAAQLSLTSATLQAAPAYASVSTSNNVTGSPGTVDMTINELHPGDTFTIRVVAQVLVTAAPNQTISNTATVTYTSLPGTNGTGGVTPGAPGTITGERTGTGGVNDYTATSPATTFTVPQIALAKSIAGTSETSTSDAPDGLSNLNARPVAVGEVISYRLTTTLPEGTSTNVVLSDTLAAGLDFIPNSAKISFVSDVDMTTAADLAGANNDAIPPTFAVPAAHISYNAGTHLLQFNLGTIANNDADNGSAEFVVIDFNVVVLNNAANNLGQIWTNNYSATVNAAASGTSNNTFVKVVEPTLTLQKTTATTTGDSGDTITYTVTVNHDPTSTADAFDVTLTDVIPAGMTYASNVIPGAGDPAPTVNIAGQTVTFTYASVPLGAATLPYTFTFDVTLDNTVTVGQTFNNGATMMWTSLPGTNGTGGVTPGAPGTTTGERTGTGGVNDYTTNATAPVVTVSGGYTVAKSIAGTSETSTSDTPDGSSAPNARPVTIGEVVSYRLTTTVPEGTSPNVILSDVLVNGIDFIPGSAKISFVSDTDMGAAANLLTPAPGANNHAAAPTFALPAADVNFNAGTRTLTFNLGNLVNNDNDANVESVVIDFNVVVTDSAVNNTAQIWTNNYALQVGGINRGTSNDTFVRINEPSLSITKVIVGAAPTDAQDTVTYDIVVTNSNAADTATAFDVRLQDTLAAELSLTSATLQAAPAYASVSVNANTTGNPGAVDMTINELRPGDSFTVRVVAQVLPTAEAYQTISNTAAVSYTSLPGTNGTGGVTPGAPGSTTGERTGTGGTNDYTATSNVPQFTVNGIALAKSIAGTSEISTSDAPDGLSAPNARPVTIGEVITYRLTTTIPEGTSPNVIISDVLANGIDFIPGSARISFVSDTNMGAAANLLTPAPGANNHAVPPTFAVPGTRVSYNAGTRTLTFTLGDLVNNDNDNGSAEFVVIDFNVVVSNNAANNLSQIWTNNYSISTGGVNRGTSNDTFIDVVEPVVTSTKAANPATGDAGDTITFTATVTNANAANTSTAFDVVVSDPLPSQYTLSLASVNVVLAGGAAGMTNTSAGNTVTVKVTQIPPGGSVTITYTATIDIGVFPSQVLTNTANATYTSLPGTNGTSSVTPGASGSPTGERTGTGGVNDYTSNGAANVTITNTTVSKTLKGTSAANTTGSNVTIGEVVTYEFFISLPEGTTPSLTLVDDLPPGLAFVPGSVTVVKTGAPLSATFNGATPTPTVNSAGGSGDDVTVAFGAISVNADGNPANNSFLIRLQATVLDVPSNVGINPPGQTVLTNNATVQIAALPPVPATPVDVTVVEPQLTIVKTFTPTSGSINDVVRVRLVVQNVGTSEAFDNIIEDQFNSALFTNLTPVTTPAGFTFASLPNTPTAGITTVRYTGSTIAVGANLTFEFDLKLTPGVTAGAIIPNTGSIIQATSLPGVINGERPETAMYPADDTSTANLTVLAPDLQIVKAHIGNFTLGVNGTFTITIRNLSTNAYASGPIVVTDTVPNELTVASVSGNGWDCSASAGQNVSCTRPGPMGPNTTAPVITLVVNPNTAVGSPFTNTANVAAPGDNAPGGNNTSSDTVILTPGPTPDLTIDKSHTGNFQVGVNGTYSLRVQNVGTADSSGLITVNDTLPTGLTLVAVSGASWDCSGSTIGGAALVCTTSDPIASLAFAPTITVTVAVAPTAVPQVTNTATVTNAGDTNNANNSDSDLTPISSSTQPDLTITKTHGGNFAVAVSGDFTLTVRNVGSGATTGAVTVSDTVPAVLVVQSATVDPNWNCVVAGQVVTCTYLGAPIAAGASAPPITITVQPSTAAGSPFINNATVTTPGDANNANNGGSDSVIVNASAAPDLMVSKTHTGNFAVGINGNFTLTVRNIGSGATTGAVSVTDTVPAALAVQSATVDPNWNCAVAGQAVTCTYLGAPIPPGTSSPPITINVQPGTATGSPFTNTATVTTPGDSNSTNNKGSDSVIVNATPQPDLTVIKTHAGSFALGINGDFTLTVTNLGSGPTTGAITVTDTVPAALVVQNATNDPNWNCTFVGQSVTCNYLGASLNPGISAPPITITVQPSTTTGAPFTNTAQVTTPGDTNAANNQGSDSANVNGSAAPDLAIDKSHTGDFVVGTNGVYNILITNVGSAATGGIITVTDTLPAGLTFVSGTGKVGAQNWNCSAAGQTVTCTNSGVMNPGATSTITLTVNVSNGALGLQVNNATVATPSDTNSANDTDADNTNVALTGSPDLQIGKTHTGDFILDNPTAYTYTLSVQNVGNAPAAGPIVVTDPIPAQFLILVPGGTHGTNWDCSATAGQNVSCTFTGTLPVAPGKKLPDIIVSVRSDSTQGTTAGSFDNIATVSAPNDTNPANNTAVNPTTINGATIFDPPIGFKTVNASGVPILQWGMTWLNPNNAAAFNVRVVDPIPAGVTFIAGSLTCTANGASTTTTCTYDAANNRIIWEGSIAPDPGVFNVPPAVNFVQILFQTTLQPGVSGVTNQAFANWDADGDGSVVDDINAGQKPGPQQSPSATYGNTAAGNSNGGNAPGSLATPELSKVSNPFIVLPGDKVIWTMVAHNPGSAAYTNVVFTDNVPPQLEILTASATAGTVAVSGQTFTLTVPVMNPGDTVTITLETRVRRSPLPASLAGAAAACVPQGTPEVINTVCMTGDGISAYCKQGNIICKPAGLPKTGEVSFWMRWQVPIISMVLLIGLGAGLVWRRKRWRIVIR